MNSALVTIARFPNAADAQAACSALRAAGIPAFLESAELAYTAWHIAAAADVKLQVSPVDRATAEGVLANKPFLTDPISGSTASVVGQHCAECDLAMADEVDRCPACGAKVEILAVEPIAVEPIEVERGGVDSAEPSGARVTAVVDDESSTFHGGMLTWMRRDLRWLVWLMVLPVVIYVAVGIAAMVASIVNDLLRQVVDVPILLLKLLVTTVIVSGLTLAFAEWRRRQRT
ncbi:MAG: hypothetical protein ACK5Q5_06295 [Planctomycetaceae bacterium]